MDASILALGSIHDETPVQFQYRWRCGDSNRAVSSGRLWWEKLFGQNTEKHRDNHIRQGIAHGNVYMHQKPVKCKAGGPNYKRTDVHPLFSVVPVQQEKVSDLNGTHGGQIPIQSKGSRLRACHSQLVPRCRAHAVKSAVTRPTRANRGSKAPNKHWYL